MILRVNAPSKRIKIILLAGFDSSLFNQEYLGIKSSKTSIHQDNYLLMKSYKNHRNI
jgi:hypothetical protein